MTLWKKNIPHALLLYLLNTLFNMKIGVQDSDIVVPSFDLQYEITTNGRIERIQHVKGYIQLCTVTASHRHATCPAPLLEMHNPVLKR